MLNKLIAPFVGLLLALVMSSCSSGDDAKATDTTSGASASSAETSEPVETDTPSPDEEYINQLHEAIPTTVKGNKADTDPESRQFLHVGIANRGFERRFELADFVRVEDADLAHPAFGEQCVGGCLDKPGVQNVAVRAGGPEQKLNERDEKPQAPDRQTVQRSACRLQPGQACRRQTARFGRG